MDQLTSVLNKRLAIDVLKTSSISFNNEIEVYCAVILYSVKSFYIKKANFLQKVIHKIVFWRNTVNYLVNKYTKDELEDLYWKVLEMEGHNILDLKKEQENIKKKILDSNIEEVKKKISLNMKKLNP